MTRWTSDRPTMQGSRFRRDPSVFRRLTWGNASKSIPCISRDQWQMAAAGCIWLRSATSLRREADGHKTRSEYIFRNKRRAWDSNPRARSPLLMVFKTIAIGH
jgi:hypothetical protein